MLIINEIANKLGSKIEFTSIPEKGNHFWFTIESKIPNEKEKILPTIILEQVEFEKNDESLNDQ